MARIALVTGANQGIGYGIVRRLCKEHPQWTVYGTSRSVANGEEACKKLKEEGLTAKFLEADLTKPSTISALKDTLVKEHGGIDILVNNAGIAFKVASTDPPALKADVTMNTNVFGTHNVCEQLFPILNDGARVVMLSSDAGIRALHAVKGLSDELYESFIKTDPPMTFECVLNSMKDYIVAVEDEDHVKKGWPDDKAYGLSVLATTLLARAYQQHFTNTAPERDIVVNAADPGHVQTNMSSYKGALTIDEGADTPYYAATLPPSTPLKGEHLFQRKVVRWE